MSKTMNLFEALEWMCRNPSRVLDAQDTGCGQAFELRLFNWTLQRRVDGGMWVAWSPYWERHDRYVFVAQERKLPELPEGCRWEKCEGSDRFKIFDATGPMMMTPSHSDIGEYRRWLRIYQALVEEFETRTK